MSENKNPQIISAPEIPTMTEQHADDRRAISEVVIDEGGENARRVTLLEIREQGGTLGNHYHMDHEEAFRLLKGSATVLLADHEEPEEVKQERLIAPAEIIVPRGVVHTFIFDSEAQMVSFMDGEFDPSDMHPLALQRD